MPGPTDQPLRGPETNEHVTIDVENVRQGRTGTGLLLVLILSAAAAAVLLIGMWMVSNQGFQTVNTSAAEDREQAAAFSEQQPVAPTAGPASEPATPAP